MKSVRILILFFLLGLYLNNISAQVTGGFIFDNLPRTYTLYTPAGWSISEQFPLLIAMHGLTQTGNEMMTFSGFNAIAENNNFVVVYPDGVSNSWNVGFPGGSEADDVGFLSALIDTLNLEYNIDLSRVYATGFSNGGFMSYRLACELGTRIAAIGPVAGTMTNGSYDQCQPDRKMPVIHIHGTNDFVVFYNGGFGNKSVDEVLSLWRGENNCPEDPVITDLPDIVQEGSTVQTYLWAPCDSSTEVILYKVINGGHTWPGSAGTTGAGNTNRDINASEEIWNFVSRFSVSTTTGTKNIRTTSFSIFPNPAEDKLIFRMDPSEGFREILLINPMGKLVKTFTIPSGSVEWTTDVSTFYPGLYLVRILSAGKQQIRKLIVK